MSEKFEISATLRELSRQVAFEESMNSTDHLLEAAEQIAMERGLTSPLRMGKRNQKPVTAAKAIDALSFSRDPSVDNFEKSSAFPADPIAAILSAAATEVHHREKVDEDADALLSSMGVLPTIKKVDDRLEDDVNALLSNAGPGGRLKDPAASNHDTRTDDSQRQAKEKYLKKREEMRRQQELAASLAADSLEKLRSRYQSRGLVTHPARVAIELNRSRDKPWAKTVKEVYIGSSAREQTFRNTREIDPEDFPASASSAQPRPQTARSTTSRSSKELDTTSAQRRKSKLMASVDRLSRPHSASLPTKAEILRDPTLRFSLYEEARECTFRPQLRKTAAEKEAARRGEGEIEAKSTFVERQEATERSRRTELDDRIGKSAYDKTLDRKVCPSCGAKQSYDEIKEKRKKCPNCAVEYRRKTTWGEVSRHFLNREKQFAIKKAENKEKVRKEVDEELKTSERQMFDKATGKVITVSEIEKKFVDPSTGRVMAVRERERRDVDRETGQINVVKEIEPALFDHETEKEFFQRMAEKLALKDRRLKRVEDSTYGVNCTFKPVITKRKTKEEEEEMDEEFDPAEAFMGRMEEDLLQRMTERPELYVTKEDLPIPRSIDESFVVRAPPTGILVTKAPLSDKYRYK